jgi:thiosulfate reductase cytochrome b subunit
MMLLERPGHWKKDREPRAGKSRRISRNFIKGTESAHLNSKKQQNVLQKLTDQKMEIYVTKYIIRT